MFHVYHFNYILWSFFTISEIEISNAHSWKRAKNIKMYSHVKMTTEFTKKYFEKLFLEINVACVQ